MTKMTWFITGTSWGIRLPVGFACQLLQTPSHTVFATCQSRSTATDLVALASSPETFHTIELDVADEASITGKTGTDGILRLLDGAGLDYVLNNAAIIRSPYLAFGFKPTDLADTIAPNLTGPALISRRLLLAIEKSNRKMIMNMSGRLASNASDHDARAASYSISKATMNMLIRLNGYVPLMALSL